MKFYDGTKDANNPVLVDTRQVEFVALWAATQAYLNGGIDRRSLRVLHIESWKTEHFLKEEFGEHPLFWLVDLLDDLFTDFICRKELTEDWFRSELGKQVGFGLTTGSQPQNIGLTFHLVKP